MDARLDMAAGRRGGLILPADLRDLAVDWHGIERAERRGEVVRVRHGSYVAASGWHSLDSGGRHRLLVRATCRHSRAYGAVSHLSAAAMHGLPLIGSWPDRVHTVDPTARGGSSSSGFVVHRAADLEDVVLLDGVRVTSLTRTLIDVARTQSMLVAVAMLDDALRRKLLTKESFLDQLERLAPRYGRRKALTAQAFADGAAGSPGESLSRVRCFELGFVAPQLQVAVVALDGREYDVDFGWKAVRKFGEFDGKLKYTRAQFMNDRTIEQVVLDEKRREDAIRAATGRSFLRWTWDDAFSPVRFARLLDAHGIPRR